MGNSKHYHENQEQDKIFPLFQRVIFVILAREIRLLKEIKGLYMGKEVKISLFPDDMTEMERMQEHEGIEDTKEPMSSRYNRNAACTNLWRLKSMRRVFTGLYQRRS